MRSDLCEGILAGGCRQSSNTVTAWRGGRGIEGEYVVGEVRAEHGAPCATLQGAKHMEAKRDGIVGLPSVTGSSDSQPMLDPPFGSGTARAPLL